jgi:hypothetical protein
LADDRRPTTEGRRPKADDRRLLKAFVDDQRLTTGAVRPGISPQRTRKTQRFTKD